MARKSTKLRDNLKGLFSRTEEENSEGSQPQTEVEKQAEPVQETETVENEKTSIEKPAEPEKKTAPAKRAQKSKPKAEPKPAPEPQQENKPAEKTEVKVESKPESKPEAAKPVSKEKPAVSASSKPTPAPVKKSEAVSPTAQKSAGELAVKEKSALAPKADNSVALARKKEEVVESEEIHQVLVFTIDGGSYGVSVLPIRSIIKPLPVFVVPGTPEFIKGLINLRGEVIPVFDLRTRFGLPQKDFDDHTRFVVVETQEKVGGLVVDEIKGVKSVPESCFGKPSRVVMDMDNRYLSSVANFEEDIILILNLEETFLIPEQKKNN